MAFDIFISYRRATGADDARLLQQALKARGYDVFFDYDSLRDGKFDENILKAIDEASVFILMLTRESLDRCAIDGDWVKCEIEHALAGKKKIIPVKPIDLVWEWPSSLPENLRSIKTEQISFMEKTTLFEESIDKIVEARFPDSLKKKCRSKETIFSTVSSASPVFVGREEEMAKLHELLVAGKFPIITGPGGTGKSELARQYAKYYQNEYPGGLFQIDMEKANSWDIALAEKLLSPASAPGADVCGILGIEKKDEKEEIIDLNSIISALNRCAEQRGNILLVLDNVETVKTLLREQIIENLNLYSDIRILTTARKADVRFRPNDHCVEFPLVDLSPDDALTLLLNDHPVVSEKEREAAQDIAQMLGFRVLYLRSIPALLDDIYAPYDESFVKLRDALKENLLETVGEAMNDVCDEDRTPDVLWEMTRQALLQHSNGPNWVKLAQIASFFSPEGFKLGILYYLWRELIEASQNCRYNWEENAHFMKAIKILKIHGLLETRDNKYSMHRLTREAVKQSALRNDPSIADNIGRSLAKETIDEKEWMLFSGNLTIISHIPERYFIRRIPEFSIYYYNLAIDLLIANNDYQYICQWDILNGSDWAELLIKQPQFADKCSWDKLNNYDWSNLLSEQPQFADKCSWEILYLWECTALLINQPQFAYKCPWDELDGHNWSTLLSAQPQFADKCPWEELDGHNWSTLLSEQPQFADKCPWEKLHSYDWSNLLRKRPQFADRCPWEKLHGYDWLDLLRKQPQFADKCPWEKFYGSVLVALLKIQPQFANKCTWKDLDGNDWAELLTNQPQFANKCTWKDLDGNDWAELLTNQPQFADKCPWNKLDVGNWSDLLRSQPQFADKCSWDELGVDICISLLEAYPQYANKCSWKKFDGYDWVALLKTQPQFADKCLCDKLDGGNWSDLLSEQPQFADKCLWDKLDGWDWMLLLLHQPQFADKCSWDKLDGGNWSDLLRSQPQFADKCPLDKLDGGNWSHLLRSQPQFADKCSWDKLDGDAWSFLLTDQPKFADKCLWTKLDRSDWKHLLKFQPQFADKCPSEILNGEWDEWDWEIQC